jgi:amino-acid N-acetyltransferase
MDSVASSMDAITGTTETDRAMPVIRPARIEEVAEILALFEGEVKAGRMLARDPEKVAAQIGDWLVAEAHGEIVGCTSLVFFNEALCELRSLSVHPSKRGNGLGVRLIEATVEMARQRKMRRVLTLTRAVKVFEQAGFVRDLVANYPEKVWRDCTPCPLRERCDEVALIYTIEPADGNGRLHHEIG